MKVYGALRHCGELQSGDVLIEHKRSGRPEDLITHAAVVAGTESVLPWIFHLTGWGGLALDQIYVTGSTCWSCYRLNVEAIGAKVADIGMYWIHNNGRLENANYTSEAGITVQNVYDIPSILTAYFGKSSFGYKARQYAGYLHRNCGQSPPDALRPGGRFFSGAICSYLPIALYQTALGLDECETYMAIDARRSLPQDLVKYFDSNSCWRNYDIPY